MSISLVTISDLLITNMIQELRDKTKKNLLHIGAIFFLQLNLVEFVVDRKIFQHKKKHGK